MRIVADEKYISRREWVGQYVGLFSLVVMLGVVVVSFFFLSTLSTLGYVALMAAMFGAMMLSFVAGYFGERFVGPAAHHTQVRKELKRLDDQYVLFQYTLPAPHVLLEPSGLTVIVVKSQVGKITCADGKWTQRQRFRFFRQLGGQEALGQPDRDVERQVESMAQYLQVRLPGVEVPIRGVLLFVHPQVELDVKGPVFPVFTAKKLKSWLRRSGSETPLPGPVLKQVEQALRGETNESD
ncbi:MAG: NERD domain-containing protein [Anaerolineae bacterium]|nr:NERD domain-containing protein [Anaerolineae bacterium]